MRFQHSKRVYVILQVFPLLILSLQLTGTLCALFFNPLFFASLAFQQKCCVTYDWERACILHALFMQYIKQLNHTHQKKHTDTHTE